MMSTENNGELSVPPGFRFHPTDEELLYYYLRKKVSYEAIDLDVIREVDLNKLEPWDLKDKCRIGSGPQNEWYFFSHKDKKYPTGTRTNRATAAGFWKATGRDKAVHLHSNSKRLGMRKTLVFYTGRAPHGQKTDWIMHEYRLDDQYTSAITPSEIQEDGWVVCRVFKKKNFNRNPFEADDHHQFDDQDANKHDNGSQTYSYHCGMSSNLPLFDCSMHLPQLHEHPAYFLAPPHQTSQLVSSSINNNNNQTGPTGTMMINDMDRSKNLLSLMSMSQSQDKPLLATGCNMNADWSFLDKLLATNHHQPGFGFDHHNQQGTCNDPSSSQHFDHHDVSPSTNILPFHYLGYETDVLKFPK